MTPRPALDRPAIDERGLELLEAVADGVLIVELGGGTARTVWASTGVTGLLDREPILGLRPDFIECEDESHDLATLLERVPLVGRRRLNVRLVGSRQATRASATLAPVRGNRNCILVTFTQPVLPAPPAVESAGGRLVLGADGAVRFANEGLARLTGASCEELCRGSLVELLHRDDLLPVGGQLDALAAEVPGSRREFDARIVRRDGTLRFVRMVVTNGAADGALSIEVSDETELRAEHLALERARTSLILASEGGRLAFFEYDVKSRSIVVSEDYHRIRRFDPAALARGPRPLDLEAFHPEDRPRFERLLAAVLAGRIETWEQELRLRTADAGWIWVMQRGRVLQHDEQGLPTQVAGIIVDIDRRKRAERGLAQSEARYRTIAELLPGFVFEASLPKEGAPRIEWASPGFSRVYGCTLETYQTYGQERFLAPEEIALMPGRLQRLRSGDSLNVDSAIRTVDGAPRWVQVAIRPYESQPGAGYDRLLGVVEDITTRRVAENAQRESEERFRLAAEAVEGAIYELDLRTRTLQRVTGTHRLYGVDPRETPSALDAWRIERVHPDDQARVRSRWDAIDQGARLIECTYRARHARGHYVEIWDRALVLRDAHGVATRVVGFAEDVSSQRRTERLLAQTEAVARVGSWQLELDSGRVTWSAETYRIFELEPESFRPTLGFLYSACCEDGARGRLRALLERARESGESFAFDLQMATKNARRLWVNLSGRAEMAEGRVVRMYGSVQDIDVLKSGETRLQEQSHWLALALDATALSAWRWHPELDELRVEYRGRGLPAGEERERLEEWARFCAGEDRPRLLAAIRETAATGGHTELECRVMLPGEERWLSIRATRAVGPAGVVVIGTTQDVSDRRAAERHLRTQARVLTHMAEGVCVVDAFGIIHLANPSLDHMFGFAPGALVGRMFQTLMPADIVATLRPDASFEFEARRADGSSFTAAVLVSALAMGGEQLRVYIVQDVTERKSLERELLEISNREQRRIGSDLHDGLGQELTGIALMLRSVAARVKRGQPPAEADLAEIVALVNDSIDSTRSLARGLSPVDVERGGLLFALRSLTARTSAMFGLKVKLRSRIEPKLALDAAATTHLYRIAQEAVTNAARHAEASEIHVTLTVRDRRVSLSVSDNGRGLSPAASTGMGLKIMRYRAHMMDGNLKVEAMKPKGTRVTCTLRQPDPAEATASVAKRIVLARRQAAGEGTGTGATGR
jgi:PAS domain S-box-containing protein